MNAVGLRCFLVLRPQCPARCLVYLRVDSESSTGSLAALIGMIAVVAWLVGASGHLVSGGAG